MSPDLSDLPSPEQQAERLIALGIHETSGVSSSQLREAAAAALGSGLLVVDPEIAPASTLTPLLRHNGKAGFVVADMPDVDDFAPWRPDALPPGPVYLLRGLDRGDHMANWSPDEALPEILAAGRSPLLLTEGIHWALQLPTVLERGRCFMTIGSRLRKASGALDSRTPALWISNGTGRDGRANRDAPKVGWCWAGNRHTWLGFASTTSRHELVA